MGLFAVLGEGQSGVIGCIWGRVGCGYWLYLGKGRVGLSLKGLWVMLSLFGSWAVIGGVGGRGVVDGFVCG